jgi:hypothetical protein
MSERGTLIEEVPLHKTEFFSNFSVEGGGFGDAAQRRALRRLKYFMSHTDKRPTLEDALRAINASEDSSLRAAEESHSNCHIER